MNLRIFYIFVLALNLYCSLLLLFIYLLLSYYSCEVFLVGLRKLFFESSLSLDLCSMLQMTVSFLFSLFFWMFFIGVSVGICRCSCLHSSGYSRLSGQLTTFFVDSRTFAALMLPLLLVNNSTILPNFHEPLCKSSLGCTMSLICGVSFALILCDFSFNVDLSQRLNR